MIAETLQSVLSQSYQSWECIVVDDGSTDKTSAIVLEYSKRDSRFHFYNRPSYKPKGANACRNFGFEKCSGNLICWLDSDDLLHPNHLSIHFNTHNNTQIDASISLAKTFETTIEKSVGLWSNIYPIKNTLDELISGQIAWQTAAILWNKNSLPVKPFDERLQSAQEWTFHIKMVLKDITYLLLDEETVYVIRHEQRIGKDESATKYKSRFLSRNIILNHLLATNNLDKTNEKELLTSMFNALKKSVGYKFINSTTIMCFSLLRLLPKTRFRYNILKVILVGVPSYTFTGKGITLFKL